MKDKPDFLKCCPGYVCTETHHVDHPGHDQYHMLSKPGIIWCRQCLIEFPAP